MEELRLKKEDLKSLKKLPIQGLNSVCYNYGDEVLKIITNNVLLKQGYFKKYVKFSDMDFEYHYGPKRMVYIDDEFKGYTVYQPKGNVLYEAKEGTFGLGDSFAYYARPFLIDGLIKASEDLPLAAKELTLKGIKNYDVGPKNVIYTKDGKLRIFDMDFYNPNRFILPLTYKNNIYRLNLPFKTVFRYIDIESYETITKENKKLTCDDAYYVRHYLELLKEKKDKENVLVKTLEDVIISRKDKRAL